MSWKLNSKEGKYVSGYLQNKTPKRKSVLKNVYYPAHDQLTLWWFRKQARSTCVRISSCEQKKTTPIISNLHTHRYSLFRQCVSKAVRPTFLAGNDDFHNPAKPACLFVLLVFVSNKLNRQHSISNFYMKSSIKKPSPPPPIKKKLLRLQLLPRTNTLEGWEPVRAGYY